MELSAGAILCLVDCFLLCWFCCLDLSIHVLVFLTFFSAFHILFFCLLSCCSLVLSFLMLPPLMSSGHQQNMYHLLHTIVCATCFYKHSLSTMFYWKTNVFDNRNCLKSLLKMMSHYMRSVLPWLQKKMTNHHKLLQKT